MLRALSIRLACSFGLFLSASGPTLAANHVSPEDIFLPENAILDTSLLFAIGAREAQQELRGSYGWDTFQEGLVEGVYFRFDPDGYARFSPNARLDTDLFEVVCQPRTRNCKAQKGDLTLWLNDTGRLQLSLANVAPGDQFFISDANTEIELPDRILKPLDARFENVLAVGGDLIIRRGPAETGRVSLLGFSAVSSYLRWVLAGQDYLVLPRTWPIPNGPSVNATSTLTAPAAWRTAPPVGGSSGLETVGSFAPQTDAAEELANLRALVEELANGQQDDQARAMNDTATEMAIMPTPSVQPTQTPAVGPPTREEFDHLAARIARLEAHLMLSPEMADAYSDIEMQNDPNIAPDLAMLGNDVGSPLDGSSPAEEQLLATDAQVSNLVRLAQNIDNLSQEFGLDPNVAALLLRAKQIAGPSQLDWSDAQIQLLIEAAQPATETLDLLDATDTDQAAAARKDEATMAAEGSDFVLLTDYFKSLQN